MTLCEVVHHQTIAILVLLLTQFSLWLFYKLFLNF